MFDILISSEKANCNHLLGSFLDESHYDILVEKDTIGYIPIDNGLEEIDTSCLMNSNIVDEERVAFIFKKGFFSNEEMITAYNGLHHAAVSSQNRGLSAGPRGNILATPGRRGREFVSDYQYEVLEYLTAPVNRLYESNETVETIKDKYTDLVATTDTRGRVWLVSKVCEKYPNYTGWFDEWLKDIKNLSRSEQADAANFVVEKWISVTNYAKDVLSGIAGSFSRYPRIPYARLTSYTRDNSDKFKLAFPLLNRLDQGFKEYLPKRWNAQHECAQRIDPKFLVDDTVFTTITVNKSFRTAAHLDAGDLEKGFSNLTVLTNGNINYKGAYIVFPEIRTAINIRPGDLLLVSNHNIIHGNTELIEPETGDFERLSIVCYFREDLLDVGSYDYEKCREDFIEGRRKNKEHPLQRPLWNGVSPNVFFEREWYDYLESKLGKDIVKKYHPESFVSTLEDLM